MSLGKLSLAFWLGLLSWSAWAADTVVLRDGSERSGKLERCADGFCRLSGTRIAVDQIRAIYFDGPRTPLAVRSAAVVLRDGSVRPGLVTFINLGTVDIGDEETDRALVAAILFEGQAAEDLLILRDGSLRKGALSTCNAASCSVGGTTVPFAEIEWVGLAVEKADPPSVTALDEVHRNDGTILPARLSGIDASEVSTTRGPLSRASVAWIHLAPPATPTPSQPGAYGAPGDAPASGEPPADPPAQPPAPPPAQPPTAPGSTPPPSGGGGAPVGTPQRGALWTGMIRGRYVETVQDGTVHEWTCRADARLREWISPMIRPVPGGTRRFGRLIALIPEGTVIFNRAECRGRYFSRCEGEGSFTLTQGPDAAQGSALYLKDADLDTTGILGFDVPREGGLYHLSISIENEHTFPVTMTTTDGETNVHDHGYGCFQQGYVPVLTTSNMDPQRRSLVAGRMIGNYSAPWVGGTLDVSWSLCRDGGDCPPPPEIPEGPPEDFDPCGRSGQQAAFRDRCKAELDLLFDSLGPAFDEYNATMQLAEEYRDEFVDAQFYCKLYDKAKEVLEAIITGGTGPAAKAAKSLLYLRGLIQRLQSGDIASLFYPSEVKMLLDYYGKAKAIWFELTADDLTKMQRTLNGCSGKVPIETYLGAKKFLENLTAAKKIWDSKVAPGINDLRSKGLECASLEHEAWRACLADAECQGVPPNCGPEPSLAGAYDE